ncbi:MAG: CHASE sensor domain-containing protein [Gammaproteobacteria bacterium]
MRFLQSLSVTRKLLAIMLITAFSVASLMAVIIVINETLNQKRSIHENRIEQLTTLADVVGSRSTAALTFDDPNAALENLNALRADPNILSAAIFNRAGGRFAHYQANPSGADLTPGCEDTSADALLLPVCKPIVLDGERIGEVRIAYDLKADLHALRSKLLGFAGLITLLLLLAFGVALLMSVRLQRLITSPILALYHAMGVVAERQDYTVRVARASDDELGRLIEGFNGMLAQIEARDAELARYSAKLEQEVAARSAELAEAHRRRIEWLETLARFLRHELKNTTLGIRTSLDLIERHSDPDKVGAYLERGRKSVSFMGKLLESVSDASSLEASFYKEDKSRLDLSTLVERQVTDYRALYARTFTADCLPLVEILGREARIIQLLDKLIANAVDYSNAESSIVVAVTVQNGQALLSVANEGEPLPADKERMFELFVSMRDSKRKKADNLGLGLYVVRLIAQSHGGQAWAEDPVGHAGAVFKVTLPLAKARAEPATQLSTQR